MSIEFKGSVRSDGLKPEGAFIAVVAHRVWLRFLGEKVLTVTSLTDGVHSKKSLHYVGWAVDLRTRDLKGGPLGPNAQLAVQELKKALGQDYDVVLEKDHIHAEYDPK